MSYLRVWLKHIYEILHLDFSAGKNIGFSKIFLEYIFAK